MTITNNSEHGKTARASTCRYPSIHDICKFKQRCEPVIRSTRQLQQRERLPADTGNGEVIRTVLSGAVSLCAGLADGRRQILHLATPGDVVCTHNLSGAEVWVEALTSTCICEIPINAVEVGVQPLLELQLLARNEFQAATISHLLNIGRLDGTERMIAFLVDMTRRIGKRENGRVWVQLPLSREDIADYLGLNPETVSRILSRIKRSGTVVFRSPAEFEVPDIADLESRSPIHASRRYARSPLSDAAA